MTSRCFETFRIAHDDTGLAPELAARIRTPAEQLDAHRKARQAAHASVTPTGLHSLHEERVAAVLKACGWADLGPVP